MFEDFRKFRIATVGAEIAGVTGGSGPPLLLLHGYPQTHVMWHKVAPVLAQDFTVIAADLRGYGASSKPKTDANHAPYSKREMAADMVQVMSELGHDRFLLCGHDRGGRVAHRLAADHSERVLKLAVLDIAPTREMYRNTTEGFAHAYWHWFWLTLPAPLPERMIGADPEAFLTYKCGHGSAGLEPFTDDAWEAYLAAIHTPSTVHAMCEDYRAAASIDIEHDNADDDRKLDMPVLALWGAHGVIERYFNCVALWRKRATNVRGRSLPGGHYLAEECPEHVQSELKSFFLEGSAP
ncbi:alpha/beta fold hydrolase [Marivita hallyeonensis]|uniref:Haloacetate dehalogenase n=1 Tax=Marivita hallyeonensis TaxID=996342 RepID=A0A1M5W356_9RHOB|nr:alpha/beta hydrolase [Marivita hallyeonensis]SHH81932.1 haloacetate dehalogenase [Marivita hallyeonensis]